MADPGVIGPMVDALAKRLWDEDHPDGPPWQSRSVVPEQKPYVRAGVRLVAARRNAGVKSG